MASPETQQLVSAIHNFLENPPKGIPPEVLDGLDKLGKVLSAGPPGPETPGRQAVDKSVGGKTHGQVPGKETTPPGSKAALAASMGR